MGSPGVSWTSNVHSLQPQSLVQCPALSMAKLGQTVVEARGASCGRPGPSSGPCECDASPPGTLPTAHPMAASSSPAQLRSSRREASPPQDLARIRGKKEGSSSGRLSCPPLPRALVSLPWCTVRLTPGQGAASLGPRCSGPVSQLCTDSGFLLVLTGPTGGHEGEEQGVGCTESPSLHWPCSGVS